MTFKQAKKYLDNMSENEVNANCLILTELHNKFEKSNKKYAKAIELAVNALILYCNK